MSKKNSQPNTKPDTGHLWSMGAVSQATGIGEHTLRAWERRFGFPNPHRLPSGHRRYTDADVSHLRLIAQALQRGHHAGEIVPMSRESLFELLGEPPDRATKIAAFVAKAMELVQERRRIELERLLLREFSALGAVRAMEDRIAPLLEKVGTAWAEGGISIGHEHFVSEVVEDLLRQMRLSLEHGPAGAPMVLAALPGEGHLLGLQMVALQVTLTGHPLHILGSDTPVEEIVAAARQLVSPAVLISVSVTGASRETLEKLEKLRSHLPAQVQIIVGGAGIHRLGRLPGGIDALESLAELEILMATIPETPQA